MSEIKIDAGTAQAISNTCAEIAVVAGVNPLFAGLIGCGVALAARLSDAGYAVPSLGELQRLQDKLAALPDLPETEDAPEA